MLVAVLYRNDRFPPTIDDLERPVLEILLKLGLVELATNKAFCVEDSIFRIRVESILGGVTDPIKNLSRDLRAVMSSRTVAPRLRRLPMKV